MGTPSIGRIVHFTFNAAQAAQVNKRREDANKSPVIASNGGSVVHVGNAVHEGDVYPAMIVRVWGAEGAPVQLQVFLDGNDTYWASSASEGAAQGCWSWPPRVG